MVYSDGLLESDENKLMKIVIIEIMTKRILRFQCRLAKLFRGYLYRKAFLASSIIFMDVYLPEGKDADVYGKNKDVSVIGDFTEDPWKVEVKCIYSEFFKAYTTIIPVIGGSSFKFVVDDELMVSSNHESVYEPKEETYNNVVTIFYYIFDQDTGSTKRVPLMNSLSLSNPAIKNIALCNILL